MANALKAKGKRELDHMRIFNADGGHIAESHFKHRPVPANEPYEPNEPEPHVFTNGGELLAHIAKTMGIRGSSEEENEPEHKGKKAAKK